MTDQPQPDFELVVDGARRARIAERLERIGPGPHANFLTLCELLDEPPKPASSMLIFHMVRELESAIRAVILPAGELPATEEEPESPCCTCECECVTAGSERQSGSGHRAEIMAIAKALSLPTSVVKTWTSIVGKQQSWAHRHSLAAPAPVDREVLERVDRLEAVFDAVLDRFQARFLEMVGRLEVLAAKAEPTNADAVTLYGKFPQDYDTLNHFFEMVRGPGWLRPARKKGYFAQPPAVDEGADGRVWTPRWPASAYLARVADQDPVTALEIAKQIPETGNPQVNLDLVNTAIAIGPARAAVLADRLARAAAAPRLVAPDRYVDLAVMLADGDQAGEALPILRAVLALAPDDTFGVVPRIGDYEYGDALARAVPPLAAACGVAALQLWREMLADAIAAADPTGAPGGRSRRWLDAVERGQLAGPVTDVRAALAMAIRDTANALVGQGLPVEAAARELIGDAVLTRVRLNLLTGHGTAALELVEAAVCDPALIREDEVAHEWLRLAHAHAADLGPGQRDAVIAAIEAGPDVEAWERRYGVESLADREAVLTDLWRRERYGALSGVLTPAAQGTFDALVATYGPPRAVDDIESQFEVLPLPPSPVSAGELASAGTAAVLAAEVVAFSPDEGGWHSNLYAYCAELRSAVAARAGVYSGQAEAFAGLEDPYLTAVVGGFVDAAGAEEVLEWTEVLALLVCLDAPERIRARMEGMALVNIAVSRNLPPPSVADGIWAVITAGLAEAPAEAPDAEPWHLLAAASIRAATSYAGWQRGLGVDADPAVVQALAAFDPKVVPAPVAIALGECLRQWAHIAPDLAETLAGGIRPGGEAFGGYLNAGFDPVTAALMLPAYQDATDPQALPATGNRHAQLGSHLLTMYLVGMTDLAEGGLVDRFYRHPATDPKICEELARAVVFPSTFVRGPAGDKFNAFFAWRLTALAPKLTSNPDDERRREVLMMSGTLLRTADPETALAGLGRVLELTGELGTDPSLFVELGGAMEQAPAAVMGLLAAWVVRWSPSTWAPRGRAEQLSRILSAALGSADSQVRELAEDTIHRAASAGHLQFRHLLQQL